MVSPTVMPKYSLTSQKPASLTCEKNSEPEPMARASSATVGWSSVAASGATMPAAVMVATVATITAAGIVAPLATTLDKPGISLLALAIGCGSLFFSHVNDAGFWLVKEYFGMTVGETIKSWSVMETIISVVGLLSVLALSVVV